ncbi:hypothetical protein ABHB20_11610 [Lacticaseibacillus paracasei]|nr:hypothetical protein [Lacticaseibacillus paracasei]MCZ2763779.1 hypothetical protein [Lacticaseibacillus paracasei]
MQSRHQSGLALCHSSAFYIEGSCKSTQR